ncbi:MAG: DUF2783 domain-containing protein [Serpentinimonas sp.]|nr:DUF2783 domain-containing protein [Serpentinimonas sp.]
MPLQRQPNIPEPDWFYAELIEAQRELSEGQADMMLAKLVLILCNHVGDRALLSEAIALARSNTLAIAPPTTQTAHVPTQ